MTDDLRARIECALGLHPVTRDGQTVPLANAVMEIVQPIADERDQLCADIRRHTFGTETLTQAHDAAHMVALAHHLCEARKDNLLRRAERAEAERDRLAAELRQHEACRTCGHERHEHAHDSAIRADYCGRCTVGRDVHDFQPEEQP